MARLTVLYAWLCAATLASFALSYTQENGNASVVESRLLSLVSRDDPPDGQCSIDFPCRDGSCCHGRSGYCGRTPEHCAAGVCVSNCNAKAECGIGADPPGKTCPLNVCCGEWGYCGTTYGFCAAEKNCQSLCAQPGPTKLSDGKVDDLVIGYIEAWNFQDSAGCAKRDPDWVPVDTLTHLNVAFYYIDPGSFAITRMPGMSNEPYDKLVNLKQKAPGLQIWLSIGGWTFSDNFTATQPVWNAISNSESNRAKFINQLVDFMGDQGFDGVDLDWEYPGAPDRGGKPEDTKNFVLLVQAIRQRFEAQATVSGHTWGLSFTAPTSYWYMRWFDLPGLMKEVDWMNLMTYDIHGSWDSPENQVGNIVMAHTNITEIQDALNLLWRNDVPANKVNLGIGFYGRTYELEDPSCRTPGCKFKHGGAKGPCTDTEGILSYDEISALRKQLNINPTYDKTAGIKYMNYNQTQWLSYDDVESLKDKKNFASKQGLRGLFIWAIDQDDKDHSALYALVDQGKFADSNGVGSFKNWDAATSSCYWSDCSTSNPTCRTRGTLPNGHQVKCAGGGHKTLCCPLDHQPDPKSCRWAGGKGLIFLDCQASKCNDDEVTIEESDYYWNNGDSWCYKGTAKYCCKGSASGKDVCAPTNQCQNVLNFQCPKGRKVLTTSLGPCTPPLSMAVASPWCCDEQANTKNCIWAGIDHGKLADGDGCQNARKCPNNYVEIGEDFAGGNWPDCMTVQSCTPVYDDPLDFLLWPDSCSPVFGAVKRKLCCPAADLNIKNDLLPVPLEYLFDYKGKAPPTDYINKYRIDIDKVSDEIEGTSTSDPNKNAFGWHIISGPPDEVTSMDPRDMSHWFLYGCDNESHERRRTVKAVCTDESEDSNCGEIFRGGVATTVVHMPKGCGPGKYAVAVSMTPSKDHQLPSRLVKKLEKRGVTEPAVFDFTFDYDWTPIVKRGDPNKRIRIDYSDDPGYWASIVAAKPGTKRSDHEREMYEEVARDHGGSWESYLDHKWSLDRRNTPEDKLHELHDRWISAIVGDWYNRMKKVDVEYEFARHKVSDKVEWTIFDWAQQCELGGFPTEMYLRMWAEIDIDVEASAQLNLIGDFGDLSTFKESSHVLFRSKGLVEASLNFYAFAKISFNSNEIELFGLERFGATFGIPGLVTIGPNFKVLARLDGEATLHTEAKISIQVAEWDYTQTYPNQEGKVQNKPDQTHAAKDGVIKKAPDGSGFDAPKFHADIDVKGRLTLTLTPLAQFGINWQIDVPDVSIDLGINAYATIRASAHVGIDNNGADARLCWGVDCGYKLYAALNAPTIFGQDLSQNWILAQQDFPIVDECINWELWDGKNDCKNCPDTNTRKRAELKRSEEYLLLEDKRSEEYLFLENKRAMTEALALSDALVIVS